MINFSIHYSFNCFTW